MIPFLLTATRIAQLGAALLSLPLARRRPDHRPVAIALWVWTLANTVSALLYARVVEPAIVGDPCSGPGLAGWPRAAAHLTDLAFLTWPAGIAALAVAVFGRRRWPLLLPALAGLAVTGYLAAAYPAVRCAGRQRVLLGAELAALAAGWGLFVRWALTRWREEGFTPARVVALLVLVLEALTVAAGPWRRSIFADWDLARAVLLALYLFIIIVQGGALWFSHSFSSPPRSR